MAEGVRGLSSKMLALVRALPDARDEDILTRLGEIRKIEDGLDVNFDEVATLIVDLEVFPVNTDHLLTIARELDRMSDLIEHTCILLQWRHKLGDEESELLVSASTQVVQLAENVAAALASLGVDEGQVAKLSESIARREEALDQIRDHYYMLSSKKGYDVEKRLWLTDVIGNLDVIADAARYMTVTIKVISKKMETHRRLDLKKGTMR